MSFSKRAFNLKRSSPKTCDSLEREARLCPWTTTPSGPLDVPQQNVVLRGLDDGSFDPGDELCWYAPSHETWDWDQDDGWTHQSPFWGDTAKWFLRTDAPQDLTLATVQTLPPLLGDVDEVRTQHVAFGVEEDHEVNLIRSGRNWFGDRLSALGANTATWNIPLANAVSGGEAVVRFAAAMRSSGTGTASQLAYTFEGETVVLTDNLLSPSSLTFARYVGGQISAPLSQSGIQVLASFTPGTEDSNAWMDYLTYQAPQNLVYTSGQMPIHGLPVNSEEIRWRAPSMCSVETLRTRSGTSPTRSTSLGCRRR